jgi:hypothetical protein
VREVHHLGRFENDDEAEGQQRNNSAEAKATKEELQELTHGAPV